MIRRRQLLALATGGAVLGKALHLDPARAQEYFSTVAAPQADAAQSASASARSSRGLPGRGNAERLRRLASLDLESLQDFTRGFRLMHARSIRQASLGALERILEREGLDPAAPVTVEQIRALVESEPSVNITAKAWLANQQVTWKTLQDHFHAHAEHYLGEMEAADRAGPGTLELAPSMQVPDWARHEVHIQPGGYVGDAFAGHIYHYGTNSFYISVFGHNEQDEIHRGIVERLPLPADGKVRRILDYGCGVGQATVALKERFPQAEVWGIDVGGPMVRYAHARAHQLGVDVQFAQRLAEDTKFPDGYFDLATSYIVHHEMPAATTRAVIDEMRRIVRPGGVFYPLDFNSGGVRATPRSMFGRWWDHRWNCEPWTLEYHLLDLSAEIASRGFKQAAVAPSVLRGFTSRHFVRA